MYCPPTYVLITDVPSLRLYLSERPRQYFLDPHAPFPRLSSTALHTRELMSAVSTETVTPRRDLVVTTLLLVPYSVHNAPWIFAKDNTT